MRYCTFSVRCSTPSSSRRAIGERPSERRSPASAEVTVGGSCRVSPTMTSCDARAAASAVTSAGSVACEPSSSTTSGKSAAPASTS